MTELVIPNRIEASANQPTLTIEPDPSGAGWCVRARNLCPDVVAFMHGRLEFALRVRVAETGVLDGSELPNISGDYEVLGDGVRFIPHFPFERGILFRAILDPAALGQPGLVKVQPLEFSFPKEMGAADTEVSQVLPSDDVLPENLLRLYVRFSSPMQRGRAEDNIEILGPDGRRAPDVLYRAPVELWDRSMTCLTILLDPGRLKRGVGPNRMLGPPLRAGQRYTLVVGLGMVDVHGRPLREGFHKSFSVAQPIRESVAIEEWKILPPAPASREPLELTFPRALDWAQLWRAITVASDGAPIRGRIDIDLSETRWRFSPDAPWQAGPYNVCVSPDLEDVCGNTPCGPFDRPFRSADGVSDKASVRLIPFVVNAS